MRKRVALTVLLIIASLVYVFNSSWRISPPEDPSLQIISHRGVHQNYHRDGLERDTCTAERIYPPAHDFMENTIRSMQAAFDSGAEVVELDVHPTTDGQLAVFHDWTLDCRTDGTGVTRSHNLAYLKTLDVGYGYTADGGRTYPLRGSGLGLMPTLPEVFSAFPTGRFLINFKSRETKEADILAALLESNPNWRSNIWGIYGGTNPTFRAAELLGDQFVYMTRPTVKGCVKKYIAMGWLGIMPDVCKNSALMIPINVAPWLWGWPNLFLQRMKSAGTEVVLAGLLDSSKYGSTSIDSLEILAEVPTTFDGYIWTNKIEIIGPAINE